MGCNHPLVTSCHAIVLLDANRVQEALPILRRAAEELRDGKYPALRQALAEDRLVRVAVDTNEEALAVSRAKDAWVDACCGKHTDAERRYVAAMLWKKLATTQEMQAYVAALDKRADVDPWMKQIIAGQTEIKLAWESRGTGWAQGVKPKGWKGFEEHLASARDAFVAAWKLAPNLPESSACMITVTMGGGGQPNETADDWFKRSLSAQFDYADAYNRMISGPMLPRWGGSHQEMMQLAETLIAEPRYDTIVPFFYLETIRMIGMDVMRAWAPITDPKIYEQMVKVMEGYAAALPKSKATYFKSLHAALALLSNKPDEARRVADEITAAGLRIDPKAFYYFGSENAALTIAGIYLSTGPNADEVKEIEGVIRKGEFTKALIATRQILQRTPKDDPSLPYLTQRVFVLEAIVKFDQGEWSPMQNGENLSGWQAGRGIWSADNQGNIFGRADPDHPQSDWCTLYWMGKGIGRNPGQSFEVSGVLTFPEDKPGVHFANGGIALTPVGGTNVSSVTIDFNERLKLVAFLRGEARDNTPIELHSGDEFTIRVTDQKLTILVGGKQIGEPHAMPAEWTGDLQIALSLYGKETTTFSKLRIRKLAKAEKKEE